jgi:hypothetical protein
LDNKTKFLLPELSFDGRKSLRSVADALGVNSTAFKERGTSNAISWESSYLMGG